jgi:hypothetical protein
MSLKKAETNNAIIVELTNVRRHPNALRLQLATVLGTTVIVDLNAKEGDVVVYFDSNLRLSHQYLHHNNLYSSQEMNADKTKKGYFGKNGKVRTIRLRGELSDGFVAELESLVRVPGVSGDLVDVGDEFQSINGVEICGKYVVPVKHKTGVGLRQRGRNRRSKVLHFHRHWDTKQLMRESHRIPAGTYCYLEEKVHGTSGRIAHTLCKLSPPWWKVWAPKTEWKILGGTRNTDHSDYHLKMVRKDIERRVAPNLFKGEQIYFEIFGKDENGKDIQTGFPYGCHHVISRAWDDPNVKTPYRAMLYRVTMTTEDGHVEELSRKRVYARAEELGLEAPYVMRKGFWTQHDFIELDEPRFFVNPEVIKDVCQGRSRLDADTLFEGVVLWFEDDHGRWTCLKHKSPEFLLLDSRNKDEGIGDTEDES